MLKALQGSPESGRLWEAHCNRTMMSESLNFQNISDDEATCDAQCKGKTVQMIPKVDDFLPVCNKESAAKGMCNVIGAKVRLPKEVGDTLVCLGSVMTSMESTLFKPRPM